MMIVEMFIIVWEKVFGSDMVKFNYLNNFYRRWILFRGFFGLNYGLI